MFSVLRLLGDLEGAGHGSCKIVTVDGDDGHYIASRLGRSSGGAGVRLPLAGEAAVQVVDIACILDCDAVNGQVSVPVESCGFVRSELLGNLSFPSNLDALGDLQHGQHTDSDAGVVVGVIGDGGGGVNAGVVRSAECDARIVEHAGQLVEDFNQLTDSAGVDIQLLQQIKDFLSLKSFLECTDGGTLLHDLGQRLVIDAIKYRIDYLDNNAVLEFVRQVEIDASAELADVVLNVGAADAGVNGVNVDLGIVRINGDEVCGDFLIRADDRGVNLDLDVGLVDLQSSLDRLGGTVLGAALVGDANLLCVCCTHLRVLDKNNRAGAQAFNAPSKAPVSETEDA